MKVRLKVGDRVRIVRSKYQKPGLQPGKTGSVAALEKSGFSIRMDADPATPGDEFAGWYFYGDEIENIQEDA